MATAPSLPPGQGDLMGLCRARKVVSGWAGLHSPPGQIQCSHRRNTCLEGRKPEEAPGPLRGGLSAERPAGRGSQHAGLSCRHAREVAGAARGPGPASARPLPSARWPGASAEPLQELLPQPQGGPSSAARKVTDLGQAACRTEVLPRPKGWAFQRPGKNRQGLTSCPEGMWLEEGVDQTCSEELAWGN